MTFDCLVVECSICVPDVDLYAAVVRVILFLFGGP